MRPLTRWPTSPRLPIEILLRLTPLACARRSPVAGHAEPRGDQIASVRRERSQADRWRGESLNCCWVVLDARPKGCYQVPLATSGAGICNGRMLSLHTREPRTKD